MEIENIRKVKRYTPDGKVIRWSLEWGRRAGESIATEHRSYANPKTKHEHAHNRQTEIDLDFEIQALLEMADFKNESATLKAAKKGFIEFYSSYAAKHERKNNRHLIGSLKQFKLFLMQSKKLSEIKASEISPELCKDFRTFLLKKLGGETPGNYFSRFKQVVAYATERRLFKTNPALKLEALKNSPVLDKQIIDEDEYEKIIKSQCRNYEVQKAFIFSLYTSLRWCDVKTLRWANVYDYADYSMYDIIQNKTQRRVKKPIHETARWFMGERGSDDELVFHLPTANGANKVLGVWMNSIGIDKHMTWSCARLSYAVLLKTNNVDDVTIAGGMGHTSTELVQKVYKRYEIKTAIDALSHFPSRRTLDKKVPVVPMTKSEKTNKYNY